MKRDHNIDAFRGIAIIGMVFFTVTTRLSSNLPDLLRHNVWGSVHLGDFILPMFLFASGLSLAYYLNKKNNEKQKELVKNVFVRFFKLAIVGVSLSIFSAYGFLEMDEVMLSAILYLMCVAISKFDWKIIMILIFLINLSYIVLIQYNFDTFFVGHYLGGYPAALYYLPIMLVGLIIGKGIISDGMWCKTNKIVITIIFFFFLFFIIFIPLNKMIATPSFMMLSLLFSLLIFSMIQMSISNIFLIKKFEYFGRKPFRYWIMMYIIFLIPVWFYVEFFKIISQVQLQWYFSVVVSIALMAIFWRISLLIDYIPISN